MKDATTTVWTHHTASTPPSPFYMKDGSTSLASISVSFDPSSVHTPNPAPHCFYPVFLGLRGAIAGGVDMQVRAAGVSSSILLCLVSDVLHPSSVPLSFLAISSRASSLSRFSFNLGLSCTSGLLTSLIRFSGIRQTGALPSVTPVSGFQLSRSSPVLPSSHLLKRHAFAACSPSITSSSPSLDLRILDHDFSYDFLLSRCSLFSVTRDLDCSAHRATRQSFLVIILSHKCQSQFLLSREPRHVYPESIPTLFSHASPWACAFPLIGWSAASPQPPPSQDKAQGS